MLGSEVHCDKLSQTVSLSKGLLTTDTVRQCHVVGKDGYEYGKDGVYGWWQDHDIGSLNSKLLCAETNHACSIV